MDTRIAADARQDGDVRLAVEEQTADGTRVAERATTRPQLSVP